jgi:hypothetical protein
MSDARSTDQVIEEIRTVRQARQYRPDPVPPEVLAQLLEVARWTGSSRNTQPWHLIVVTDKELLGQLSRLRTPINWVAEAPLAIAIVLDGESPDSEAYDEGRMTERVLVAAKLLGLGGGTAWFGDEEQEAEAKRLLGIPQERTARSLVVLGYPTTTRRHAEPVTGGRKPYSPFHGAGERHRYGRWRRVAGGRRHVVPRLSRRWGSSTASRIGTRQVPPGASGPPEGSAGRGMRSD